MVMCKVFGHSFQRKRDGIHRPQKDGEDVIGYHFAVRCTSCGHQTMQYVGDDYYNGELSVYDGEYK